MGVESILLDLSVSILVRVESILLDWSVSI